MSTKIHVWSDYVCPFCLIADELIERAITDRTDVEVVHHAHELRPHPRPTLRSEDPYLPDIWHRAVYPMAGRHEVSMELPSMSPQPYTDLAFRGAQYAADQGRAESYHRRMMTAFFRENLDIRDRTVLARLAEEIGLDPAASTAYVIRSSSRVVSALMRRPRCPGRGGSRLRWRRPRCVGRRR